MTRTILGSEMIPLAVYATMVMMIGVPLAVLNTAVSSVASPLKNVRWSTLGRKLCVCTSFVWSTALAVASHGW